MTTLSSERNLTAQEAKKAITKDAWFGSQTCSDPVFHPTNPNICVLRDEKWASKKSRQSRRTADRLPQGNHRRPRFHTIVFLIWKKPDGKVEVRQVFKGTANTFISLDRIYSKAGQLIIYILDANGQKHAIQTPEPTTL
jgi:hypothetical protein